MKSVPTILTVGVYGTTEDTFFRALVENDVTDFVDIRRRRGMRGSQYRYVNSTYLQTKLASLGIIYHHIIDLAPTSDIRLEQQNRDAEEGVAKTARTNLSNVFVERYKKEILATFDLNSFLKAFDAAKVLVLFCVEHAPDACHRSIVGSEIASRFHSETRDITP